MFYWYYKSTRNHYDRNMRQGIQLLKYDRIKGNISFKQGFLKIFFFLWIFHLNNLTNRKYLEYIFFYQNILKIVYHLEHAPIVIEKEIICKNKSVLRMDDRRHSWKLWKWFRTGIQLPKKIETDQTQIVTIRT